MELGDENNAGLAVCADNKITNDQVSHLAQVALDALLGRQSAEDAIAGGPAQSIDLTSSQKVVGALACLFLQSAKMDVSSKELASLLLDEHRLQGGRTQLIADAYRQHKPALREVLARNSAASSMPQLTSTDWRMDMVVANESDLKTKKPLYHMTLHTQSTAAAAMGGLGKVNGEGEVRFQMNEQQLEELLMRLRDACRAVEENTQ